MAEQIFYFVAGARFLGYKGVGTRGGVIFLRIWQFLIKCTPPEIKF